MWRPNTADIKKDWPIEREVPISVREHFFSEGPLSPQLLFFPDPSPQTIVLTQNTAWCYNITYIKLHFSLFIK